MKIYKNISPLLNSQGCYKTRGAKMVSEAVSSLDNMYNAEPILRSKAANHGFSLETLRPNKFQKVLRKFTDLFRSKEYLHRRNVAAKWVDKCELRLKNEMIAHKAELARKRFPWEK